MKSIWNQVKRNRERFSVHQVLWRIEDTIGAGVLSEEQASALAEGLTRMVRDNAQKVALDAAEEVIAARRAEMESKWTPQAIAAREEELDAERKAFEAERDAWDAADERFRFATLTINGLLAGGATEQAVRSAGLIASAALGMQSVGGSSSDKEPKNAPRKRAADKIPDCLF